jgi:pSer/pThr/pTyr-binding forkhead associated (FHA) protein
LVIRDRDHFEMTAARDPQFPPNEGQRIVRLDSGQVTIGRFSSSRGDCPDIDLSAPPADPGVSHEHAVISRRPDGTWSITDRGSMNGTYLNDDPQRLPAGQAVALAAGDRVHVGAWTTIVLRPIPVEARAPT